MLGEPLPEIAPENGAWWETGQLGQRLVKNGDSAGAIDGEDEGIGLLDQLGLVIAQKQRLLGQLLVAQRHRELVCQRNEHGLILFEQLVQIAHTLWVLDIEDPMQPTRGHERYGDPSALGAFEDAL